MTKLNKLLDRVIRTVFSLRKIKKNKIIVLESSFPSGSNTRRIYQELRKLANYEVVYVDLRGLSKLSKIKLYWAVSNASLIIATHGFQKIQRKQKLLNLWHGIPLKAMNFMEEKLSDYSYFNDDYLVTNSKFDSVLLASCMAVPFQKHIILGSPRLDFFYEHVSKSCFNMDKFSKVIFYLPTFRSGFQGRTEGFFTGNLFNLEEFNFESFDLFLKKRNILLLTKYHQNELGELNLDSDKHSNIINISDDLLISHDIDLYEILPSVDLLVTDYSSVFFDFLHSDKPIIFSVSDLHDYKKDRGFLLEPFEEWTPGEKVITQEELESAIDRALENDIYASERERLKKIVFNNNNSGKNTHRLVKYIVDILEEI